MIHNLQKDRKNGKRLTEKDKEIKKMKERHKQRKKQKRNKVKLSFLSHSLLPLTCSLQFPSLTKQSKMRKCVITVHLI